MSISEKLMQKREFEQRSKKLRSMLGRKFVDSSFLEKMSEFENKTFCSTEFLPKEMPMYDVNQESLKYIIFEISKLATDNRMIVEFDGRNFKFGFYESGFVEPDNIRINGSYYKTDSNPDCYKATFNVSTKTVK